MVVFALSLSVTLTLVALWTQRYFGERLQRHVIAKVGEQPSRSAEAGFDPKPFSTKDEEHWNQRIDKLRRGYLDRTRETAGKWRDVFSGLLAVFGAVLVVGGPSTFQNLEVNEEPIFLFSVVSLTLATNAVFYAGWAATGMPKVWVDFCDAKSAMYHEYVHASRSLVRLRVALTCGGAAVAGLIVAVALALGGRV